MPVKIKFNRSIICVDDEEGVLDSYRDVLLSDPGKDLFSEILDGESRRDGDSSSSDRLVEYTLFLAESGEEAIRIVEQELAQGNPVAAGFFDMRMPGGMDGYETIKRIKEIDPRVFCAVVTAFYDRNIDQIRQLFVDDHQDELLYFRKPFSSMELKQTAFNMISVWNRKRAEEKQFEELSEAYEKLKLEIDERECVQQNLEKTQELLTTAKNEWEEAFNTINDAITIHDLDFNILRANLAAEKMFKVPMEQLLNQKCYKTYHGLDSPPEWCLAGKLGHSPESSIKEYFEPQIGKYIEVKVLPRLDSNNTLIGLIHVTRDIDARKRAEEEQARLQGELIHAQKMEVLGRLAGGVAHDFNNVLTPIVGYSELSVMKLPADNPVRKHVALIHEAGQRASGIVKQLLAFSRKQVLEMKPASLNLIVENMAKMLGRLIGEDIIIEIHTEQPTGRVMVDTVQIEQVLMNLAVNARDAMPKGGHFSIDVADVEITDEDAAPLGRMDPGSYVLLRVGDTGSGIQPELLDKIFEPFFTTKAQGKGTGLGLATVYGVVKQHNGFISVDSEIGTGTTFAIYLPVTEEDFENKVLENDLRKMPGGTETVLLAEDDQPSLQLISETLQELGYKVLEACDGTEAMEVCESFAGKIDVLITDVIMPGLNGRDLADKLIAARPETKIIFMSGYTDEFIARHGILEPGVIFLQKPVMPSLLADKLREVLDEQ
ncbi:MAG: response regulator [Desulfobulbaceae bacterium]|nr:response regulator [Desulfobulbaceae bacterium]